jgi:hypothetical protein
MQTKITIPAYISLAFFTALACLLLCYIDKDSHSLADLFKPGNIVAEFIYFIPTYLVCGLCHSYLFKRSTPGRRMAYALAAGIPTGFALVILMFVLLASANASLL